MLSQHAQWLTMPVEKPVNILAQNFPPLADFDWLTKNFKLRRAAFQINKTFSPEFFHHLSKRFGTFRLTLFVSAWFPVRIHHTSFICCA